MRSSSSVCAACVFVFSFYVSLSLFVVYISLYTFEHSSCWCGRAHLSVQRVQPLQPPSSPRAGEGSGEAGRREAGLRGNRDNSRTGHPAPPTASRLLREQPCDHLLLQSPKESCTSPGLILAKTEWLIGGRDMFRFSPRGERSIKKTGLFWIFFQMADPPPFWEIIRKTFYGLFLSWYFSRFGKTGPPLLGKIPK